MGITPTPEAGTRGGEPAARSRRSFLSAAAAGMVAGAAAPGTLLGASSRSRTTPGPLPPDGPGARMGGLPFVLRHAAVDEGYWRLVREQFPIRRGIVPMNAANLCPSPYAVIQRVEELTRDVDGDPSFQNRAKLDDLREAAHEAVARYLAVDPDDVAITRNTSEGNNVVVGGLELGPGDEVVLWDQNHPTNNVAWDVRARRFGFTVRRVATPPRPRGPEDLLAPFLEAMGPRTRVVAFSHVSNVSGVALPAARLCRAARERGALTLVDGAQTLGCLRLDLGAMGCDFYTASAHKWLMGPKEAGILYVRPGQAAALWPGVVGVGWDGARDRGARRFGTLGQRDDAAVVAVGTAVEFHEAIGADRVEARVRALADALLQGLAEALSGLRFHVPEIPELRAGVVAFDVPDVEPGPLYEALYRRHGIGGASRGGAFAGLRLSPHVYNTQADMERAVAAVADLVRAA